MNLRPNLNLPGDVWMLATCRPPSRLHSAQFPVQGQCECRVHHKRTDRRATIRSFFSTTQPTIHPFLRRYEILDEIAPVVHPVDTLVNLQQLAQTYQSLELSRELSPVFQQALTLFGG